MRRELEVMQVLRVPPMGKLVVEVNEARYEHISEITDEKVKRVLLAAIGELIDFAGNYETLVEAGVAPPQGGVEMPSLEQQQEEFLARLEAEHDAVSGGVTSTRVDDAQPGQDTQQEVTQTKNLSVAEQIDGILQKFVEAEPEMANRVVRLVQDASGGIGIEVDGQMYQKPTDIAETQIQQLIKRAVQEWDST